LFEAHLDTALRYGLPLVLHVRKAMHKVFLHAKRLKKARAVVFHSYSGTADEAASILRHGINAYFSFGTALLLNHRKAMVACRSIEAARLLFESDAPYQRLAGREFSEYADVRQVIAKAAELRSDAGRGVPKEELERITDGNFFAVYNLGLQKGA
jgi:TatD DNase family protein